MYQSTTNPKYYIPDLLKYWCRDCDKEFILSDGYDNSNVVCPYCQSKKAEAIVWLEDEDTLSELGCMAIGFNREDN